jgi:hypothetical protein
MNRRKFLKKSAGIGAAALGADPIRMFLASILESAFHSAYAQQNAENHFNESKYISLYIQGGPLRNHWDYVVKPRGDADPFLHNKSTLNNSFFINSLKVDESAAEGFSATHRLVKDDASGLYLPALWESRIPLSATGASAPMLNLAQNMAVLRGIKMADSHSLSRTLQTAPLGRDSIGGMVADQSQSPLPAVNLGSYNLFRSEKGLAQTVLSASEANPVGTALNAFSTSSHGSSIYSGGGVDRVLDVMGRVSSREQKLLPVSYFDRLNARKLLSKSLSDLIGQFPSIQAKYELLVARALSQEFALPDSDGLPLAPRKTAHFRYTSTDGVYLMNSDLTKIFTDNSTIKSLSSAMAVAEIMLTGCDLKFAFSSYLNLGIGGLLEISLPIGNGSTESGTIDFFENDSHYAGNLVHLYAMHRYYRAISACLYELVSKLKSVSIPGGTLFDKTVIDVNSEFNRVGGESGYSTVHGGDYSGRTLFSGMIPKLTIAGNIFSRGTYYGPGGLGAPVKGFGGQIAGIGNVCATVASLLGVKAPTPNHAPFLIRGSGQKAVLAVEGPQNVENG